MRGSYILGPAYLPTASGPGLAAWIIDGNTNGSEKYIGTNDNYAFPIRTNGIEKLCVGTAGQIFRGSGSRNLFSIAFSTSNTSWGYLAGNAGVSGVNNTLIGGNAGLLLTTGTSNTAVGYNAGQALVSAVQNTFIGNSSGFNVTGDKNTALGYTSLSSQTSGIFNVAVGGYAGRNFFSGYAASAYNANIFIGMGAGDGATDGSYNIFMGLSGGYNFQSGDRNILIGNAVISTSYGAGSITQPYPTSSTNDTLGFGNLVQFTASNQIVFGSSTYYYTQAAYAYSGTGVHTEYFRTSTPFGVVTTADRGSVAYVDTGTLGAMYLNQTNAVPGNGWARVLTDNYDFGAVGVSFQSSSVAYLQFTPYAGNFGGNNVSFNWSETSQTIGLNCASISILGDNATGWQINGDAVFQSSNPITTASQTLLKTNAGFSDGAGALAGTLNNAPMAGDPTKWIPVDDNGTTRYIPTW